MKTTEHVTLLLIMVSMIFMASCDGFGWECIRGNNRIATETRSLAGFDAIESNGSFIVEVTTGSHTGFLEVEGDENLLAYVETYIQGNRLVLETRNNKCIRSKDPVRIRVSTPGIRTMKMSGSGAMYCDHITADELFLDISGSGTIECHAMNVGYVRANISGSGSIELWGRARESDLTLSGSGMIRTINLIQENCYATISGSGNIYADVTGKLDVTISGSGNFYYSGDPEITQSISGSGSVRRFH